MAPPQENYTLLHTEFRKARYNFNFFHETISNDFQFPLITIMRLANLLKAFNIEIDSIRGDISSDLENWKKRQAELADQRPTPPIYSVGYRSLCEVLDWKEFDRQTCFIADIGRVPPEELIAFWKKPANEFEPLTQLPAPWEMFAIEFRDQMCRAIMHLPNNSSRPYVIILVDSVDILELEPASQCRVYALPKGLELIQPFSTLSRIIKFQGGQVVPLRDLTTETIYSFRVVEPTTDVKCLHIEIMTDNPFKQLLKYPRDTLTPSTSEESDSRSGSMALPTNYAETVYKRTEASHAQQYVQHLEQYNQQEEQKRRLQELFHRWNSLFNGDSADGGSPATHAATRATKSSKSKPISTVVRAAAASSAQVCLVPILGGSGTVSNKHMARSSSFSASGWRSPSMGKQTLPSSERPSRSTHFNTTNQRTVNWSQSQSSKQTRGGAIRKNTYRASPPLEVATDRSRSYTAVLDMISRNLALPRAGETISIRPTFVTTLNEFFAIFTHNEETLEALSKKLFELYKTHTLFSYTILPKMKEIVLVRLDNDKEQIVRAVVVSTFFGKQVEVLALDFGLTAIVALKNIYHYEKKLCDAPFQAALFRIYNIKQKDKPGDPTKGYAYLQEKIEDKMVDAQVTGRDGKYVLVRIIDEAGFDLGESMAYRGFMDLIKHK